MTTDDASTAPPRPIRSAAPEPALGRYERLAAAFVGLADTLIADYDVIELTQQLIDHAMTLLPITAAGIGTPEEAFDRLRHLSQTENTKLHDIARRIVEDAVRRARARR